MNLQEFLPVFNTAYNEFLEHKLAGISDITKKQENQDLFTYAKEMSSSGKRIRPYLCYLSYISNGGSSIDDIIDICIALELVHTFALFHDDIMDESGLRRGKITIHNKYKDLTSSKASDRSGESMAMLVGDMYYTWAFEKAYAQKELIEQQRLRDIFHTLLEEVIHGQIIDIVVSDLERVTTSELREKNKLKTSSYTFMRPMQLGAALAGVSDFDALLKTGEHLGEAFQVIDDVIDIAGNSKTSEKDICLDVETAQHTLISNYILDNGTPKLRDEFFSYFGKKLSPQDKVRVQELAQISGAIEQSKLHANQEIDTALDILKDSVSQSHLPLWQDLCALLKNRMS